MLILLLALQQGPTPPPPDALVHRNGRVPPAVTAVRAPTGIKLDGALDDPAWISASPVSGFRRDVPSDGKPATESTEVRVLYDKDALYVGARLFSPPGKVSRRLGRRDSFDVLNDVFFVLIDSYHDHTTTFVFGVTAAGERRDGVQTGDGSGLDPSWDPVWSAKTRVDSLGWTAEIRIPFSQLRFPRGAEQVWGIQFRRDIRAAGEADDWAWSPRAEPGTTSKYGHLLGLRDIAPPRRLELLPYTLGKSTFTPHPDPKNPFDDGSTLGASAGVDLKYGLTSNLTLDATVNPDFGQVEADPAVVNLSAFETFFEEHRPFFVEGAGIFGFGPAGSSQQFFYSRRVGKAPSLTPSGSASYVDEPTATSIIGAGKLSGRTRTGWSVAVLEAVTGKEYARLADASGAALPNQAVEPLSNYAVGRIRRDFRGGSSAVGGVFTAVNRRLDDPAFDQLRSAAYTGGLDFLHRFNHNAYSISGYLGGSVVQGSPMAMLSTQQASSRYYQRPDQDYVRVDSSATSLGGTVGGFAFEKGSGNWVYNLQSGFTSPGMEMNDAGFQTDADRIRLSAGGGRRWLTPGRVFRSLSVGLNVSQRFNFGGVDLDRSASSHIAATFNSLWGVSMDLGWGSHGLDDRATRGGPLMFNPGGYHVGAGLYSDSRRALSGGVNGFLTGNDRGSQGGGLSGVLAYRPQGSTDLSVSANYFRYHNAQFYVTQAQDPAATATFGSRYVFSGLDQDNLNITIRLNVVLTPNLSVQWYAQPFVAAGDYEQFDWFATPRSYDFVRYGEQGSAIAFDAASNSYTVDADGAGPAKAVTFTNPDFRVRSFRSNLVLRWEYHPGSTLFVVWNQNRGSSISDPAFRGFRDLWGIGNDPYQNILLVKLNYYLSR